MDVEGLCLPRFEPVRAAFAQVLDEQAGPGAALAVWQAGEWVLDLWGGYADIGRTRPWRQDTLVMPYSVTKPYVAVCGLLLADRGLVDLDAPLVEYWPQLRAATTLRQVLAHQAGLVVLDEDVPTETFYDWDRMCALLARQAPLWEPGTAHGESALFYGHLVGEVVRRVDGRSLGRFLREEVCLPLGLDFHVGVREADLSRAADLVVVDDVFRDGGPDASATYQRALGNPPGARDPEVVNSTAWRTAEVPAINGHGTARSVAGLYVALQEGALVSPDLLAQATSPAMTGVDRVLGGEPRGWGLGVAVEPDGYGMGGTGGSLGWWSVDGDYALGFVTAALGTHERSGRLEDAVRAVLDLPPL